MLFFTNAYLRTYGYLPLADQNDFAANQEQSKTEISSAFLDFQRMAGLQPTGVADKATLAKMAISRCGIADHQQHPKSGVHVSLSDATRKRRYVLMGYKWSRTQLTYRIEVYTRKVSAAKVDIEVASSFKMWSDVSALSFRQVASDDARADITIKFLRGDHHDGSPFDGMGGILGHAYQPESGKVHLDEDENWMIVGGIGGYLQINIRQIVVHEVGHALGLKHSRVRNSAMYPFYEGYNKDFKLHQDDIDGMQSIYGKNKVRETTTSTTTTTTTTTTPAPTTSTTTATTTTTTLPPTTTKKNYPICKNPEFDAVTIIGERDIYAFRGSSFYILNGDNAKEAHSINHELPGVPNDIDAALSFNGKTYIFKDEYVFTMRVSSTGRVITSWPRRISRIFHGAPKQIDSAFVYREYAYLISNGVYYKASMIAGRLYTRFTECSSPFDNAPNRVDGVFTWPSFYTEVFSGDKYFQSESGSRKFTKVHSIADYWLDC